ncbi:LysR substrate-binding domain-containing protein [Stenotrophomonas sp. HITSZ_GD]|uniref:LysR substrate-binding domain-containing protein n=1 Tax=Stenotrophomonas sp. HITSZ_GD TaxID=3037248 RepID=UPI00240E6820|nr:LysR substrate-binding domain-containing protein [Stenotrophomonas sp. HITSZ_GD]MDG2524585.1 LysR substrate-binding domain-containing protein [Stenotrophomonas sp. HITSZ_GD]
MGQAPARLNLTAPPSLGMGWLAPRLDGFHRQHPHLSIELEMSRDVRDLSSGQFDAAIRAGHGHWRGLHAARLFPCIFMPLCAPPLRRAAGAIEDPGQPLDLPLLGRPDWWRLWYRARGFPLADLSGKLGARLPETHLDVAAAVAGQGVAIASPLVFERELRAGLLVPAHTFVASDGRAFWFAAPVKRCQHDKIARLRRWLEAEAAATRQHARPFLSRVVACPPALGD